MGFIEDRLLKINFHKHFQRLSSFAKDLENDKELVLREAGAMDIFCEGVKLGREYLGKKWICSTDETPEPFRDIWMNIKGDGVVVFGYYAKYADKYGYYKDIKEGTVIQMSEGVLYWQYAETPKPVEVKK